MTRFRIRGQFRGMKYSETFERIPNNDQRSGIRANKSVSPTFENNFYA